MGLVHARPNHEKSQLNRLVWGSLTLAPTIGIHVFYCSVVIDMIVNAIIIQYNIIAHTFDNSSHYLYNDPQNIIH